MRRIGQLLEDVLSIRGFEHVVASPITIPETETVVRFSRQTDVLHTRGVRATDDQIRVKRLRVKALDQRSILHSRI